MRETTVQEYEAAIHRALMRALEDPNCCPADLADAAGFSAFHFSRMFAGMVGESPGELLKRLRLERAALSLKARQRVTEVAFDAGYESLEAFSRAFRNAFGCSPSQFATTNHVACLPAPSSLHMTPDGSPCLIVLPHLHRGKKSMNVEIQESIVPQRVIAIRHIGPYNQIGPVFQKLVVWAGANNVSMVGPGLAIFHDDPESVSSEQLRSDACIPVVADFTSTDPDVQAIDLPGGRYAVATHTGSYAGLGDAWSQFIGKWIPTSGEHIDFERPCYEVYLNDCSVVSEEQLLTQLYEPIR
ncbi:MAG: GyrI-like domain-containing protein [Armatimonas sp.]